ncbi:MAG: GNAT family N-acetyltransferase [Rhodoferax sp.]
MAEDYVTRVVATPAEVDACAWDSLLHTQGDASPFMHHAYLSALHTSASAGPGNGWTPHFILLYAGAELAGACLVYEKTHSYGEYVFDWAWANAYAEHGLPYYPKALVAVPFTPVPGVRLLARTPAARRACLRALLLWCQQRGVSSLHLLFLAQEDAAACAAAGLMLRHNVQFHWTNRQPGYPDFDAFLACLTQDKRKKIRQERRKVHDAGVRFRWAQGGDITPHDWDFFYECYARTYLEHGNPPYLKRGFFARIAHSMPQHWLMFTAERDGRPMASSLIALSGPSSAAALAGADGTRVAYGRYWGALERIDCLHFETCYYQPLQWCIEHNYQRFEGGAQGEHKMARALLPVKTTSAHWLAHPAFADAVARHLQREGQGIDDYLNDLAQRNPLRRSSTPEP